MSYPLRDRTLNPTGPSVYQQGNRHCLPPEFQTLHPGLTTITSGIAEFGYAIGLYARNCVSVHTAFQQYLNTSLPLHPYSRVGTTHQP
ncbi:hypothetical protein [Leptothermofonsia sp. ETS-13]|uniref:hypothetical protein n=1 Tax=Leptothermofonsia sp. ETS-13 TaxID=3035696 RepID=UPI003B9E6CC4